MKCVAWITLAMLLASAAQRTPAADEDPATAATVKVVKVAKDKGEMTVALAVVWAKPLAHTKAEEVTVVFLFQDKKQPALKLDAALLGKLDDLSIFGALKNGCSYVLRPVWDLQKKKSGEVLQVIGAEEKQRLDFRKNGEYTLKVQLRSGGYRGEGFLDLPTDAIHVGLFQETDPKQWQQYSTSYRRLSNVVEVPNN